MEQQEQILEFEEEPQGSRETRAPASPIIAEPVKSKGFLHSTFKSMFNPNEKKKEDSAPVIAKDMSGPEKKLRLSSGSGGSWKDENEVPVKADTKMSPKQVRISQEVVPPSFSECVENLHQHPYNLTESGFPEKRSPSGRRLKSALKQRQQIGKILHTLFSFNPKIM